MITGSSPPSPAEREEDITASPIWTTSNLHAGFKLNRLQTLSYKIKPDWSKHCERAPASELNSASNTFILSLDDHRLMMIVAPYKKGSGFWKAC